MLRSKRPSRKRIVALRRNVIRDFFYPSLKGRPLIMFLRSFSLSFLRRECVFVFFLFLTSRYCIHSLRLLVFPFPVLVALFRIEDFTLLMLRSKSLTLSWSWFYGNAGCQTCFDVVNHGELSWRLDRDDFIVPTTMMKLPARFRNLYWISWGTSKVSHGFLNDNAQCSIRKMPSTPVFLGREANTQRNFFEAPNERLREDVWHIESPPGYARNRPEMSVIKWPKREEERNRKTHDSFVVMVSKIHSFDLPRRNKSHNVGFILSIF